MMRPSQWLKSIFRPFQFARAWFWERMRRMNIFWTTRTSLRDSRIMKSIFRVLHNTSACKLHCRTFSELSVSDWKSCKLSVWSAVIEFCQSTTWQSTQQTLSTFCTSFHRFLTLQWELGSKNESTCITWLETGANGTRHSGVKFSTKQARATPLTFRNWSISITSKCEAIISPKVSQISFNHWLQNIPDTNQQLGFWLGRN